MHDSLFVYNLIGIRCNGEKEKKMLKSGDNVFEVRDIKCGRRGSNID